MSTLLARHIHIPLASVFAFAGILACPLHAQDGADPFKKPATAAPSPKKEDANLADATPNFRQISTTVEWVEMDANDALELTRKGLAPNSPELIAAIRQKETEGKATLLNSLTSVTRSGQRSAVESTQENIYPTEFQEPGGKNLTHLDLSGVQSKGERFAFVLEPPATAQPKAFEMRPTGARLEVDPVISSDGKVIDLNIAPELIRMVGTSEHGLANMGGQLVPLIKQPVFIASKITTAVTLASGQTIMVALSTPLKDDGSVDNTKKVLTLVHAMVFSDQAK